MDDIDQEQVRDKNGLFVNKDLWSELGNPKKKKTCSYTSIYLYFWLQTLEGWVDSG